MRILILLLLVTGTAHGAEIFDERSNRIGRTEERQGRIEVYDTHSNRIGAGVRQPDGSIDFRDPQGNRIGRTGSRLAPIASRCLCHLSSASLPLCRLTPHAYRLTSSVICRLLAARCQLYFSPLPAATCPLPAGRYDARSNRVGLGRPDATGRYQYEDRGSTRRGSGDASGPVWLQRTPRK